ncbi:hypothetical protein BGX26_004953 [Mortierella sp. AD094]|nr:hypothetical protein BGX26_004953 [Mortierella sp. AD094]
MMGERGLENHEDVVGSTTDRINSPRSLDQGSHAEALKGFSGFQKKEQEKEEEEDDAWENKKEEKRSEEIKKPEPKVLTMQTTTIPMFRNGRLATPVADPVAVSHVAAEEAQSPTKDDDLFRNIPVRPSDYGHQEGHATKEHEEEKEDSDSWDDPEDEDEEDFKRPRVFGMKSSNDTTSSSKVEENFEKKLGDISFGAKLNRGHERSESKDTIADNDKAVDEDEWDTTPADDFSRRETVAGM